MNNTMTDNTSFHITITRNDTGETLLDTDTRAIIASVNKEGKTSQQVLTCCNSYDLACALATAEGAVRQVYEENPELYPIVEYVKATRIFEEIKNNK